ncbi:imidazole glycerol phosphate synthase subunit HisH [Daejeonia sp. YH14]|uniref:imidazole glycerol phosphate synthase subunit HisH n=1 Tax=Daejeonia sp. YH14 TaxID=3439042 RepID=UPI003F4936F3
MIAIIKYNAGNVESVQNALLRLGATSVVTDHPEQISKADKVIFPGVGEASSAMRFLKEKRLDQLIPDLRQPVLGICLGQQLMCRNLEEGNVVGMNIFPVDVKRFPAEDIVPHMGWNSLKNFRNPLFKGVSEDDNVYFVHSYYCENTPFAAAECDYILPFAAALQKDNFFATQFHPEKSGKTGAVILQNFLELNV